MALFGYNKKKYDINTRTFADKLWQMQKFTEGGDTLVRERLGILRHTLSKFPYVPGTKDYPAIDSAVESSIAGLAAMLHSGKLIAFHKYAEMLQKEIYQNRATGRHSYSGEAMLRDRKTADILITTGEAIERLEQLEREKSEIIEQAKGLDEGIAKKQLMTKYNTVRARIETENAAYNELVKAYNVNIMIENTESISKVYDKIDETRIMSREEYDRFAFEAIQKKADFDKEQTGYTDAYADVRSEIFGRATESEGLFDTDFDDEVSKAGIKDLGKKVASKTASSNAGAFDDEFRRLTGEDSEG